MSLLTTALAFGLSTTAFAQTDKLERLSSFKTDQLPANLERIKMPPGFKIGLSADHVLPEVNMVAHAADLGMMFYTGNMFPAEYKGGIFSAQHGSSNRMTPVLRPSRCPPFLEWTNNAGIRPAWPILI